MANIRLFCTFLALLLLAASLQYLLTIKAITAKHQDYLQIVATPNSIPDFISFKSLAQNTSKTLNFDDYTKLKKQYPEIYSVDFSHKINGSPLYLFHSDILNSYGIRLENYKIYCRSCESHSEPTIFHFEQKHFTKFKLHNFENQAFMGNYLGLSEMTMYLHDPHGHAYFEPDVATHIIGRCQGEECREIQSKLKKIGLNVSLNTSRFQNLNKQISIGIVGSVLFIFICAFLMFGPHYWRLKKIMSYAIILTLVNKVTSYFVTNAIISHYLNRFYILLPQQENRLMIDIFILTSLIGAFFLQAMRGKKRDKKAQHAH